MKYLSRLFVCGGVFAMVFTLTGCRSGQGICHVDRCADVPCGAIPANPGSHVCEWQQAQVRSASNDLGVFYQADFVVNTNRLSPAAEQQVGHRRGKLWRGELHSDHQADPAHLLNNLL